MKKDAKKQKSPRFANLLASDAPATTLVVVAEDQLGMVVGGEGSGPKLPKSAAD
ncbi:MAG: hypothetical protein H0V17_15960 [Deltaproteobacteria bacterium]|nr:hypothetical protein [Deltaproteobacteria bacterium]